MAVEKLTTQLKNKTWTNPQIKNHKRAMNSDCQEHTYLKLTSLIPSVEKIVNFVG
jgi:hypothetical protein